MVVFFYLYLLGNRCLDEISVSRFWFLFFVSLSLFLSFREEQIQSSERVKQLSADSGLLCWFASADLRKVMLQ